MLLNLSFTSAEVEIVFDEETGRFSIFVYRRYDNFSQRVIDLDYDEDPYLLESILTNIITNTIINLVNENVNIHDTVREFVSQCIVDILNENEEYEVERSEENSKDDKDDWNQYDKYDSIGL